VIPRHSVRVAPAIVAFVFALRVRYMIFRVITEVFVCVVFAYSIHGARCYSRNAYTIPDIVRFPLTHPPVLFAVICDHHPHHIRNVAPDAPAKVSRLRLTVR
jgi:hypothetical protein